MADKDVKIRVATEGDLSGVKPIEAEINKLKQQKLRLDIDANTQKLQETEHRIQSLKTFLDTVNTGNTNIHINDSDIKKAEEELAALEAEKIDVNLDVETAKLEEAKLKLDAIDDESINPQINTISAMEGIEQIGQGFDRLKQGASEVGQRMGEVLQSAGRMEQTEAFLSMNMGADQAKQKLQEIRSVTDQLPGDDVTLQNLLSQAAMKDASMTTDAFNQMGSAAADYMAAMQNFGKTSTETQQDLMNYILAGNTAEIERSPILQSHVDKLKEGTTVQERAKLLQEALNEEGWAGIASQDIYNNKFQQFNDMIERGKMNLGGMFQEAAKGAMDWVMQLDESTHGLVGMSIALAGFATPLTDTIMGLGQMATGIKAVKDAADFAGIADKLSPLKTALVNVGSAAKTAALELLSAGKNALLAGANAVKSAAMWAIEKGVKLVSIGVSYALAAAQAILNAVMSANPIMLVVIAIVALIAALVWAYNNVDWFREMVDNAWASIQGFAGWLSSVFMGAVTGIGDAFNNAGQTLQNAFTGAVEFVQGLLQGLYDYIMTLGGLLPEGVNITGNQIIDSIIAVMAFIATLPIQLAMIFMNIIASALGFGNNFSQTMITNAANAVMGFIQWVSQIPSRLGSALSSAISSAVSFGSNFVSTITNAASNAVSGFVSQIGQMSQRLGEELNSMIQQALDFAARLPQIIGEAAANMVSSWVGGSGEQSPGFMYDAFYGEIDEMGEVSDDFNKFLPATIGEAAKNMVNSFNPSLSNGTLNGDIANGGYGGQVNFYFSDITVDNDDRMEKIYDYITRRLHWNNKTAGRGV